MIDCLWNGKAKIIYSVDEYKRYSIRISQNFLEACERSNGNVKVKLDLSNYATNNDLEEATIIDTSTLALKKVLVSLKSKIGKLMCIISRLFLLI